jgi:predicted metalloprotease
MQTDGRRESDNVEDRRSGGGAGKKIAAGGGVLGIVFLLVQLYLGGDPAQLMNQFQQQQQQGQESTTGSTASTPEDEAMARYVKVALADNEDVWTKIFQENGMTYTPPVLVLFRGATKSGCGNASSSTGPFYCPADQKVYIDLSFFDELKNRFGASGGDFALAYVLAHEVGHHIQNLLGTSGKVHQYQQRVSEKEGNKASVSLELQADFYAGVWAHHNQKMKNVLEEGDIEEALSAASAVGDDHIQKQSQGYVVPDGFTHGTSEQRMYWFKLGFHSGDIKKGDTFK